MRRFALATAAAALLASCGRFSGGPSKTTPVILISIDTLRSDHLPAYGYAGVSTPNIDAFRADSVLYQHAYSHCPLTLPSHATILTGRLPADTGLRDNTGYKLTAGVPTLAEVLKQNGYATGAAVSAFVLRRESGIERGFDFYDDDVEPLGRSQLIGMVQRHGSDTARVAKTWIDSHGSKPFFFFLHLYEPHTPYEPPEPYYSRYQNHYDGEIAYVDQIVGDFLTYLKQRDLYDKSLIIFLSDHGEGLNDHGEEEHGIFLYREALQVPLIVKLPHSREAGKTVAAPAELVDIFPTVLEQTATRMPQHEKSAESLLRLLRSREQQRQIYSETYYPRFHFGWSDLHSLIDGTHHYIRAPIPELYDLAGDPAEKKNSIDGNRRTYVAMRAAIEPYVKKAAAPSPIEPEEAAKLAALGYVGSTVATRDDEVLPDPKNTVDVFRQIRTAYTLFRDEKQDEALALTNKLLQDNNRILDLWDLKSKILGRLGRNDEAIEAAKEGLRQQPNAVGLIMTVANLSILTGKLDQAVQHAELLMKTEPSRAHEILARVWAQKGDYARATAEAKLAMNDSHDPSPAFLALGLIEKQQGHLDRALEYFDQAQEKLARHRNKNLPNLHFYRGDVLARLGRQQEAEQEFRKEIAAFPSHPDAYTGLILLLSAEGRVDEATKLVFELVRVAPSAPSYVAITETMKAIGDNRGAVYWASIGLQRYPTSQELRNLLRAVGGAGSGKLN